MNSEEYKKASDQEKKELDTDMDTVHARVEELELSCERLLLLCSQVSLLRQKDAYQFRLDQDKLQTDVISKLKKDDGAEPIASPRQVIAWLQFLHRNLLVMSKVPFL